MIDEIKELFQTLLVPQIEAVIKLRMDVVDSKLSLLDGKIDAIDAKLVYTTQGIESKLEAFRRELLAEIRRVESNVDVRLVALDQKTESLRRELVAEIKAAR